MNASKFFIASVAALSFTGAATLAYAQSTTPSPSSGSMNSPSNSGMQQPMAPSTTGTLTTPIQGSVGGMSTTPSRSSDMNGTSTLSGNGNAMPAERTARADRN